MREANNLAALPSLIHQLMGTVDLDRGQTRQRLAAGLSRYGSSHPTELDALVTLLGPYGDEQGQEDSGMDRAKARYVLIRRLLQSPGGSWVNRGSQR